MSSTPRRLGALALTAGLLALTPVTSASAADSTVGSTGAATQDCNAGGTTGSTSVQTATPDNAADYDVKTAGVITSWSFQADPERRAVNFRLKTGRAAATGTAYTVVGQSDPVTTAVGATGLQTQRTRVAVAAGDVIGLSATSGPCVVNKANVAEYNQYVVASIAGDAQPGAALAGGQFATLLNISAVVEADADRDGFGDTTQDRCPTQAATQGACIVTAPPVVPPTTTPTTPAKPSAFSVKRKFVIKGKAVVGATVKVTGAKPTNVTPRPGKIKIQWSQGPKKIKGATKPVYKPTRADVGAVLKAKVTITGSAPKKVVKILVGRVKP